MNKTIRLSSTKVIDTISLLEKRISDRFPNSGLRLVCQEFLNTANNSSKNIDWISRPNILLRIFSYLIIFIGVVVLIYSVSYVDLSIESTKISSVVAFSESIFNDIILLGAAVFFFITMESRIKRKKAIKHLNELRFIVHVIDMHQLTKDPSLISVSSQDTKNSPDRKLTKFELERYLDYCSEMTALVAKVAALYAQSLPDEVVVSAVNDIEVLCTGQSRKIWQKIIILNNEKSV